MERCVIIGAAPFGDAAALRPLLRGGDFFAVADGGIRLANALQITPQLIVSDCDSAAAPAEQFVHLPVEKDMTDSRAAMDLAFSRGYREFLLLGCLGGRLDHTIANLLSARQMTEKGCHVELADEKHRITVLLPGKYPLTKQKDTQVSLFAMSERVKGITLHGMKYPLSDYCLLADDPLCVSNEVTAADATLSFDTGVLLLIFSKD